MSSHLRSVDKLNRLVDKLQAEIVRLRARVARLEHQADCYWYDLASGQWARDHCEECDRLHKAAEAAKVE